jgi:hypothetical protein
MQSKPKPSRVPAKRTQVINFAVFQQTARIELAQKSIFTAGISSWKTRDPPAIILTLR